MKNTDKQKSGKHTDPTYKNSDTGQVLKWKRVSPLSKNSSFSSSKSTDNLPSSWETALGEFSFLQI